MYHVKLYIVEKRGLEWLPNDVGGEQARTNRERSSE